MQNPQFLPVRHADARLVAKTQDRLILWLGNLEYLPTIYLVADVWPINEALFLHTPHC